jgi:riboflavin kinase / FMN adenylyltransferase
VQIHYGLDKFNAVRPVITIGTFDGVHLGHRQVISRLKEISADLNGESVVFTFYPHPRIIVDKKEDSLRLLSTQEEKIALLQNMDIDHLVVYPFTEEFSKLTYHEFVKDILVDKMHLNTLVIGYDHKFGQDRQGDFLSLKILSTELGFNVERLDEFLLEDTVVSSTKIRKALDEGNIRKANHYLGYKYILMGRVIEGKQLGRKLGFPTANIETYDAHKLVPRDGVYAVRVELKGKFYKGMLNVGVRPTVNYNADNRSIEVHLFDFNQDIYLEDVTLHFEERIRDEQKFSGLEELSAQLLKDKESVLQILSDKSKS